MSWVAPDASRDDVLVPGDCAASWGLAAMPADGREGAGVWLPSLGRGSGTASWATDERERGEDGWAGAGPEAAGPRGLFPWSKDRRPFPVGVLPCADASCSSSYCIAGIPPRRNLASQDKASSARQAVQSLAALASSARQRCEASCAR